MAVISGLGELIIMLFDVTACAEVTTVEVAAVAGWGMRDDDEARLSISPKDCSIHCFNSAYVVINTFCSSRDIKQTCKMTIWEWCNYYHFLSFETINVCKFRYVMKLTFSTAPASNLLRV